jgi:hypothetical protein
MLAGCEEVELSFADVLLLARRAHSARLFPIRSFISLVMPVEASNSLEVGLVGEKGWLAFLSRWVWMCRP